MTDKEFNIKKHMFHQMDKNMYYTIIQYLYDIYSCECDAVIFSKEAWELHQTFLPFLKSEYFNLYESIVEDKSKTGLYTNNINDIVKNKGKVNYKNILLAKLNSETENRNEEFVLKNYFKNNNVNGSHIETITYPNDYIYSNSCWLETRDKQIKFSYLMNQQHFDLLKISIDNQMKEHLKKDMFFVENIKDAINIYGKVCKFEKHVEIYRIYENNITNEAFLVPMVLISPIKESDCYSIIEKISQLTSSYNKEINDLINKKGILNSLTYIISEIFGKQMINNNCHDNIRSLIISELNNKSLNKNELENISTLKECINAKDITIEDKLNKKTEIFYEEKKDYLDNLSYLEFHRSTFVPYKENDILFFLWEKSEKTYQLYLNKYWWELFMIYHIKNKENKSTRDDLLKLFFEKRCKDINSVDYRFLISQTENLENVIINKALENRKLYYQIEEFNIEKEKTKLKKI